MTALIFDISKHLTPSELARVKEQAKRAGISLADYIERTLKQRLYAPMATARRPAKKGDGK